MDSLNKIALCGVVPVVVIEDAQDAVATARALLAGGIDVMEITFRTAAAAEAIRLVSENCPEMCVGAGTVLTLEQGQRALENGARFIVSPGFNPELVRWCVDHDIATTPGCVTPSEITAALEMGIDVCKFFPANIYGGLDAMKAMAAPFGKVKFIPTGGISEKNLSEYMGVDFVHAVGGSWLCSKADIADGNFTKITQLSQTARKIALGYELAHIGINCTDRDASLAVCSELETVFGFAVIQGSSSNFSTSAIEVMNEMYLGDHGHLAIRTSQIGRAIADLKQKGFAIDQATAKYKNDKMIAVYLTKSIGGFAIHLLQK